MTHGEGQREGLDYHRNLLDCSEKQEKGVNAKWSTVKFTGPDTDHFIITAADCSCKLKSLWMPISFPWDNYSDVPLTEQEPYGVEVVAGSGKLFVQRRIALMQVFMSLMAFSLYNNEMSKAALEPKITTGTLHIVR